LMALNFVCSNQREITDHQTSRKPSVRQS
jgi:hypothetical protein